MSMICDFRGNTMGSLVKTAEKQYNGLLDKSCMVRESDSLEKTAEKQ